MKRLSLALALCALGVGLVRAQSSPTKVTSADAARHLGETKTVCGLVADARFASGSNR